MATPSTNTRPIARGLLPSHILFEEADGIYWLRGTDLERAKKLIGLRCDGCGIGFDRLNWSLCVQDLASKHVAIGLVRGNVVRAVRFERAKDLRPLRGSPIDLLPEQLFGRAELERVARQLTRCGSELRSMDSADWGTVFAYQVTDEFYEVDWELTSLPLGMIEAMAVAAHLAGRTLPCQLVPPKPRRARKRRELRVEIHLSESVPYGQLTLPL